MNNQGIQHNKAIEKIIGKRQNFVQRLKSGMFFSFIPNLMFIFFTPVPYKIYRMDSSLLEKGLYFVGAFILINFLLALFLVFVVKIGIPEDVYFFKDNILIEQGGKIKYLLDYKKIKKVTLHDRRRDKLGNSFADLVIHYPGYKVSDLTFFWDNSENWKMFIERRM